MSGHTRGPWEWDAYQSSLHNDKGEFVLWFGGSSDEGGTTKDNARLIAAAPELLEALTRLRDCYSTSHSPATRQSCWDQAIAAIAKATGEQP